MKHVIKLISIEKNKKGNVLHAINVEIIFYSLFQLHISNSTLLERSNQNSQIQRDLQYYKTAQENYDSNYRKEKV